VEGWKATASAAVTITFKAEVEHLPHNFYKPIPYFKDTCKQFITNGRELCRRQQNEYDCNSYNTIFLRQAKASRS
jgi:hypothetical protein